MKVLLHRTIGLLLILSLVSATRIVRPSRPASRGLVEGYWREEPRWADDRAAKIEWQNTWETTYKTNHDRWSKELTGVKERDHHLQVRMIVLLEAMLAKYPDRADRHVNAYREIADHLKSLGYIRAATDTIRKGVQAMPGNIDMVNALWMILMWVDSVPADAVDYAAGHVMVLNQIGQLADTDNLVIEAYKAQAVSKRRQGQFMAAAQALDGYLRRAGQTDWYRVELAALYVDAGHTEQAITRLQTLAAQSDDAWFPQRIALLAESQNLPGRFAGNENLSNRWAMLQNRPIGDAGPDLLALLAEDAGGKNIVAMGSSQYASLWTAVDRALLSTPAPNRAALAITQQADAQAASQKTTDPDAALSIFRRFPLSKAGQQAMLNWAEQLLRRGKPGLAYRCFEDLLAHADQDDYRRMAQVGLWLAMAQSGQMERLSQQIGQIPPQEVFPWRGQKLPAAAIMANLAITAPSAPRTTPSTLALKQLTVPALDMWPPKLLAKVPGELLSGLTGLDGNLQSDGQTMLLAAPNVLIALDADARKPKWMQVVTETNPATPTSAAGGHRRGARVISQSVRFTLPGPFRPAMVAGRIYARWGGQAGGEFPTAIAAFDAATGQMLWTSEDQPSLRGLWPAGDAAIADGRVYYLAISEPPAAGAVELPATLVCLDADNGQVVFRSRLADLSPELTVYSDNIYQRDALPRVDLARFGNPPAVIDGAVYCSTNMGLVARFDARDGALDWASTYTRCRLTGDSLPVMRRQGSAPLIFGDLLIVAPRDRFGLLALNRHTGQVAWEKPFEICGQLAALPSRMLLATQERQVAVIRPADGQILWQRSFAEAQTAPPVIVDNTIFITTGNDVCQLAADSGVTVNRLAMAGDETIRELLAAGNTLLAITDRSASGVSTPPVSAAMSGQPQWQITCTSSQLLLPPTQTNQDNRLFVAAGRTLICRATDGVGAIVWQRTIRPALRQMFFADGGLVLVYGSSSEIVDAATGQLRWQTPLPLITEHASLAGRYLVVAEGGRRRYPSAAGLDLATGQLAWFQPALGMLDRDRLAEISDVRADGELVHIIGRRGGMELMLVTYRAADGVAVAWRDLAVLARENELRALDGLSGCAFQENRVLTFFNLAGSTPTPPADIDLFPVITGEIKSLTLSGPWVTINTQIPDRNPTANFTWVFHSKQPDYRLKVPGTGLVRGDRFYQLEDRTMTVYDLPSAKRSTSFVVPVLASIDWHTRLVDFRDDGKLMSIVSIQEQGPTPARRVPRTMRLDLFDSATGQHRTGQVLGEPVASTTPTQATWVGGQTIISDGRGLRSYTAQSTAQSPPAPSGSGLCYRLPPANSAANADDRPAWPFSWSPGSPATLSVAHDDDNLYLTVSYRDDRIVPSRGHGPWAGGDRLELKLTTNIDTWHLDLGADDLGKAQWGNLGISPLPAGIVALIRHDLASGQHQYHLTIPLAHIAAQQDDQLWRRMRLSLSIWDADSGAGQARPVADFGQDGGQIYLYNLSRPEEAAALALADQLPDLPASRALLQRAGMARAAFPAAISEFYQQYLKRHPNDGSTLPALFLLDKYLRPTAGDQTTTQVLRLAQNANIDPAQRQGYLNAANAYLSQWVYLDAARQPGMILLQLSDGQTWDHRVSWGQFLATESGAVGTPSRRVIGQLPPAGAWQELRLPLLWLEMHDKPITGICFGQVGGQRVLWGPSTIVSNGKSTVLIGDSLPAGKTSGLWDWVTNVAGGQAIPGGKAHTSISPITPDQAVWHDVSDLKPAAQPTQVSSIDSTKALAVLEAQLPQLGNGDAALEFFRAMLDLTPADPAQRLARHTWFIKTMPNHPAMVSLLGQLMRNAPADQQPQIAATLDQAIEQAKVPLRTRYAFRRQYTYPQRSFLRQWQVLGPLPNVDDRGLDYPFAPESTRTRLESEYQGLSQLIRWKPAPANSGDYVDLAAALGNADNVTGYAVCWVYCPKAQAATLEIGGNGGTKVWLNRRVVHNAHQHDWAEPGMWRSAVYLPLGWNEVLLKSDQLTGPWGFYAELVDPEGRGPVAGLKTAVTPP